MHRQTSGYANALGPMSIRVCNCCEIKGEIMRKLLVTLIAGSFGAFVMAQNGNYNTGFEAAEGAGWGTNGAINPWAPNGFSGTVTGTPGFGNSVRNTGLILAGLQSAEVANTAVSGSEYTAVRSVSGIKKIHVATLMAPILFGGTGQRGFGLVVASGYRLYLARTGTNAYKLEFTEGAGFSTTTLATFSGSSMEGVAHFMSMTLDNTVIGTGTGKATIRFNGNVYSKTWNVSGTTSPFTSVGMISRPVSGTSSGTARFDRFSYSTVPEPATMVTLGASAIALIFRKRKA